MHATVSVLVDILLRQPLISIIQSFVDDVALIYEQTKTKRIDKTRKKKKLARDLGPI